MAKCRCGARCRGYAGLCRKCDAAERAKRYAEAARIVATGKCPDCGASLRRNLALRGWWQCEQFGAVGFRADSTRAACGFQTFTEV